MECNIPAAIALEHLNPASRQHFGRSEHVGSLGVASKRNDGRVLQQQEQIADLSSLAQFDQPPLQTQTFAVVKGTELDNGNHR
jgi:hypothetical protein